MGPRGAVHRPYTLGGGRQVDFKSSSSARGIAPGGDPPEPYEPHREARAFRVGRRDVLGTLLRERSPSK